MTGRGASALGETKDVGLCLEMNGRLAYGLEIPPVACPSPTTTPTRAVIYQLVGKFGIFKV